MTTGSGLFSDQSPIKRHLVRGTGGVAAEVGDLRRDIGSVMEAMAALAVEEFIDVATADTDGVLAVVQSKNAEEAVYEAADLVGAAAVALDPPRNVTVTTGAGGTPAESPSEATIVGKDVNGAAISEVIPLSQVAGTDVGAKAFALVESVTFKDDGTGTGAALEVGFGTIIGLGKKIVSRAGFPVVHLEIEAGTPKAADALAGTYAAPAVGAPNGTYDPGAAPNDTNDYALYYEYDPTA